MSDAGAAAYVEREVRSSLPDGWWLEKTGPLAWSIRTDERTLSDFILYVTADRRAVILLHGNTDAGPGSIEQALLKASYIPVETFLVLDSLSQLLRYAFEHYEPNQWGLT